MTDKPDPSIESSNPDADSASRALLLDAMPGRQKKSALQEGFDAVTNKVFGAGSTVGTEVARYAPQMLKTAALFAPGRLALAATVVLGAVDQVKLGDSLGSQLVDLGLGASKGLLTKKLFERVGSSKTFESQGVAARGVFLGVSNRAIDVGLTRESYLNGEGKFDLLLGSKRLIGSSFNKQSLLLDAAVFATAHASFHGLNRLTSGAIDKSPALKTMFTGGTFGASSGGLAEIMRQQATGKPYDFGEIVKRTLLEATTSSLAVAPIGAFGGLARNKQMSERELIEAEDNFSRQKTSRLLEREYTRPFVGFCNDVSGADLVLLPGERVKARDSSGYVSGAGVLEVSGASRFEVYVPKGLTMRIVLKDGIPDIQVAENSKGKIEVVNETENQVSPGLLRDAHGNERSDVIHLDPLADIFTVEEISQIRDIQRQKKLLKVSQLTGAEIQALADEYYGTGAERKERIMHMVAGPPGAGKSSHLVQPLAERHGALVLDPDLVKPRIPGYEGGMGTDAVHADSRRVIIRVLERALANGDNIVYPQTGGELRVMEELIQKAKDHGYKVGLHLADLPPDIAAKRVVQRMLAPPDDKGIRQIVDPEFALRRIGRSPRAVFDEVTGRDGVLDEYSLFDMHVPRGQTPRLIRKYRADTQTPSSAYQAVVEGTEVDLKKSK